MKLSLFLVLVLLITVTVDLSIAHGVSQPKPTREGQEILRQIQADVVAERWEQAWAQLEAAAAKLSGYPDFYFLRAAVLFHRKEAGRALEELDRAIRLAPRQHRYYSLRGEIYEHLGDFSAAESDYRRSIELEPDNPAGVILLAEILVKKQRQEEAVIVVQRALGRIPGNPVLHYELGHLKEIMGNRTEAIASYSRAVRLDSLLVLAHAGLGRLYRDDLDTLTRSAEHLQQAIRLDPQEPAWYYHLGATYRLQRNWEAAQDALEKAARLYPQKPRVYSALADVYRQRSMPEKARHARQRFVELSQETEKERLRRARLDYSFKRAQELESSGQWRDAVKIYEQILDGSPNEPKINFALARVYLNADEVGRAEEYARRAVERQPENANYHRLFALTLAGLGRLGEAVGAVQTAIRLRPSESDLHNLLGNVLLDTGQFDAAIDAYQRAVELAPEVPAFHLNLSVAYRRRGDEAAAAREEQAYKNLLSGRPLSPD